MTLVDDVNTLRNAFEEHVRWNNVEHTAIRKDHETDNRVLVKAVNDLQITVERGINKVIMVVCGALASVAVGTVVLIVPHIH